MIQVIPAIDLIEGKCVRLVQGDFARQKVYNEDPVAVAKQFEQYGIKRLHLVDLDGARTGSVKNWGVLEAIVSQTKLTIDFGGGITTATEVATALNAGASYIAIGSLAVKNKTLFTGWLSDFGADKFLLAADVRNEKIAVHGWKETTGIDVFEFINGYLNLGLVNIFCTDISKDGMMQGPATLLYGKIIENNPGIKLIASGGVRSVEDIAALEKTGCDGVIIGKALYEGTIELKELEQYAY